MRFILGFLAVLAVNAFGATPSVYWATNSAGEAVLYLAGPTNEMAWTVKGHVVSTTNAVSTPAAPAEAVNPTNIAGCTYFAWAGDLSGSVDGAVVATWPDHSGNGLTSITSGSPVKQTDSGKAVFRCDGLNDYTATTAGAWTTYAATNQGTVILRIKPASGNTQTMPIMWGTTGNLLGFWAPYDGVLYFDWADPDFGRVNVALPADWTNAWHSVVLRRTTGGVQTIRVDGLTIATSTGNTSAFVAGNYGFYIGSASGANYWAGDVRGVAVWNTSLSDGDADSAAQWMATQAD